mgnify:CR=1 FL=1
MNVKTEASFKESLGKDKVAVIGAGIVGVNCALALQILGYQVTLIDKQGIGEGCSKGNAGHFATEQVFPLAEPALLMQLPKMLLDPLGPVALSPLHFIRAIPWFVQFFNNMRTKKRKKNAVALKALNKHAIDYYKPLLEQANAEYLLIDKGSLLVFEKTSCHDVSAMHKHYQQAGVNVELLNQEQALALEPNLNDNINYALYFTEVAHTGNPWQICLTLADYAKSLGMAFEKIAVERINQDESGVVINVDNKASNEALHFDHCVVATGAWSKSLLKDLGYSLPIEAERGYSRSINLDKQASPLLSRPVASAERRFIITPMENMLRLSGTVEYAGLNAKANNQRADMLLKNAEYILKTMPVEVDNSPVKGIEKRWMGPRPSLPDSLPVICKAPKHNRLFFALGHQHLGLTQGAITGKLIGQLVSEQKTDIDVSPFCISRFN